MKTFIATEFISETCEATGRKEVYLAKSLQDAVRACFYAKSLVDAMTTHIGKTGKVVYTKNLAYTVTAE